MVHEAPCLCACFPFASSAVIGSVSVRMFLALMSYMALLSSLRRVDL